MATSKVGICNVALALIGENSIRSFDEDNSRARLCERLFDVSVRYIIGMFDWPFARGFAKLQHLTTDLFEPPEGFYAYQIPADCAMPRDIFPRGTHENWELVGEMILTQQPPDMYLYYTRYAVNPAKFSDGFANAVSELLASRLANPLKQDKELAESLYSTYGANVQGAISVEANIGSEYRHPDEDPNNDSFVTGED